MRIGFDVSGLDHERISGVGTYIRHLGQSLGQDRRIEVIGEYRFSRRRYLSMIRRHWSGPVEPIIPLFHRFKKKQIDLFHGPDFRVPELKATPRVVTIHDLAYYQDGFADSKFAQRRRQLTEHLMKRQRPEAVIAVSQFTQKEILERFPEYQGRVHFVWHGADHLLVPSNRGPRPMAEPYFLFVGNLEARKNIAGVIRAFELFKEQPQNKDVRLVLVGKPGFQFDQILSVAKSVACKDHIVLPGFITNMGLVNYYQWAEAFLYPSHYEGFGFPILEAMRLGCPVITSKGTSTQEVSGDAALLVDPNNREQIAAAMSEISENSEARAKWIEKGRVRGREFTWKRCSDQTIQVYESVL